MNKEFSLVLSWILSDYLKVFFPPLFFLFFFFWKQHKSIHLRSRGQKSGMGLCGLKPKCYQGYTPSGAFKGIIQFPELFQLLDTNCVPSFMDTSLYLKQEVCVLSHFSHVRLCNPVDCSPPGSSVHGILQARILEWIVMHSSRCPLTQGSNPHLPSLLHW